MVCVTKSQSRYFQKAKIYEKEFKCCFGMIRRVIYAEDVICEGCRKAVEEQRRTGNSFQYVSAISSYH